MRGGTPLKRLASIVAGQSPPSEQVQEFTGDGLPFLQGNAEFGVHYPTPTHRCDSATKKAVAGNILVSVRAPVGALNVANRHYGIGRGLAALQCGTSLHGRFCWWWMHSVIDRLRCEATGSTYEAVAAEDIGALLVPVVDPNRQRAIADFLDAETARIDALIANKQTLVFRIRERFSAQVERMMLELETPRVPLQRFVKSITQGTSPQAGGRPAGTEELGLLKLSAVKDGQFWPGENKVLDTDTPTAGFLAPKDGDLLVTRSNTPSYVGEACAIVGDHDGLVLCDLIYRLRLDRRILPEFAAYALRATASRAILTGLARGTSQSMVKVRGEDVKSVPVPVPPLDVQHAVVGRLNRCRSARDRLVSRIDRQCELLREHRRALITAAVTGGLAVPGGAA